MHRNLYINDNAVFGMPSMTYAYKANAILKANGFDSHVIKLKNTGKMGCVYGVNVRSGAKSAYALLSANNLEPTSLQE